MHALRVLAVVLLSTLLGGCAFNRTVNITTDPPGAAITVDGKPIGVSPRFNQEISFSSGTTPLTITARKVGYRSRSVTVLRASVGPTVELRLPREAKRISVTVEPAARLSLDGMPLTQDAVAAFAPEIEFFTDSAGKFVPRRLVASRAGFEDAEVAVTFEDASNNYLLRLEPVRKAVSITSEPPGAAVELDGKPIGVTPLRTDPMVFEVDAQDRWIPKLLRLTHAGYEPRDETISWDEGRTDYAVVIPPRQKMMQLTVKPTDASATIDGRPLPIDSSGRAQLPLAFPPIDDSGTLRQYELRVSHKDGEGEWTPATRPIEWDEGRGEVSVELKRVLTRPLPLLVVAPENSPDGWIVTPKLVTTLAYRAIAEPADGVSVARVVSVASGSIDSLALSPDGSRLTFSVLTGDAPRNLRGQLRMVRPEQPSAVSNLTDGQSLDMCPSFTPDGRSILFASNRAGRRGGRTTGIWSINADGTGGVRRLMAGADTLDLWPQQDSDPEPRVFYESRVDGRDGPRVYMTPLGTVFQTDLAPTNGGQPRVGPKNDAVIFVSPHEQTGRGEIYRMDDRGGSLENLTNTPDADDTDPAFSPDGTRVVFASDRATTDGRPNTDLYLLDLQNPSTPRRLTANGSIDDRPVWDPSGDAIYFRSNRGAAWAIWKLSLK